MKPISDCVRDSGRVTEWACQSRWEQCDTLLSASVPRVESIQTGPTSRH